MEFFKWILSSVLIAVTGILGTHQTTPSPTTYSSSIHTVANERQPEQFKDQPMTTAKTTKASTTSPQKVQVVTFKKQIKNPQQQEKLATSIASLKSSCSTFKANSCEVAYQNCVKKQERESPLPAESVYYDAIRQGIEKSCKPLLLPTAEGSDSAEVGYAPSGCRLPPICVGISNKPPRIFNVTAFGTHEILVNTTKSMTFSVADPHGDTVNLSVRVEWGDGTSLNLNPQTSLSNTSEYATWTAKHAYNQAGDYTILITAQDSEGGMTQFTNFVHVTEGVLLKSFYNTTKGPQEYYNHLGFVVKAAELATFNFGISSVNDKPHEYVIAWGDGTSHQGYITRSNELSIQKSFSSGTYRVQVNVDGKELGEFTLIAGKGTDDEYPAEVTAPYPVEQMEGFEF